MTTFGDRLFYNGGTPVGGDLLGLLGPGKVFYLDPNNGDDANDGLRPSRAFKTMQFAADQAGYSKANGDHTGVQDVIVRIPGVEEVSATIDFDGNGGSTTKGASILVVAATAGQRIFGDVLACHTRMASTLAAADDDLIEIVYRNISFYGMSFGGRGTGKRDDGHGALLAYRVDSADTNKQAAGGGNFHMIRGCNFRDDGGNNVTGVYEYGAGASHIYQCTFGYNSAARGPTGIVTRGSGTNNPFDVRIEECYFNTCPTAINVRAGTFGAGFLVYNNIFQGNTESFEFEAGVANTGRGLIARNVFDTSTGTTSWINSGGSGQTQGNVTTDTGIEFADNRYKDDA